MFIIIFIQLYLFYLGFSFKNLIKTNYETILYTKKDIKFSGYDYRYIYDIYKENITENSQIISKFKKNLQSKVLLNQLLDPNYSINTKIKLLEENDELFDGIKIAPNLNSGNLMKDWDFEF